MTPSNACSFTETATWFKKTAKKYFTSTCVQFIIYIYLTNKENDLLFNSVDDNEGLALFSES